MIRPFPFMAAMALLAAAPALAQPGGRGMMAGRGGFADPSAVIAAELAFNRLAQNEGQWTAFRKTAAKDAVMFTPRAVNAQAWLKGRADPAKSVMWWPSRVFMSCDGGYAVSTGSWQRADGSVGYFTTIWRREKNGTYRWVLDHGDALPAPRAGREDDLEAKVARCERGPRRDGERRGKEKIVPVPIPPPAAGEGGSADGTLAWSWAVAADDARTLTVRMRQEDGMHEVVTDVVKAPGA